MYSEPLDDRFTYISRSEKLSAPFRCRTCGNLVCLLLHPRSSLLHLSHPLHRFRRVLTRGCTTDLTKVIIVCEKLIKNMKIPSTVNMFHDLCLPTPYQIIYIFFSISRIIRPKNVVRTQPANPLSAIPHPACRHWIVDGWRGEFMTAHEDAVGNE